MKIEPTKKSQFEEILHEIVASKRKVFKEVNSALIELYFNIGKYISIKINSNSWGKSIVKELADYLKEKEPNIKGFNSRNLWRMKQFYETYQTDTKLSTMWSQLNWSNNRTIFSRCKTKEEREFYLMFAIKERWTNRELEAQINKSLFERTMIGNENLSKTVKNLPQNTENMFRDSYIFDFLDIPKDHSEKELQKALILSLKEFILEIGKGFAFIGEEYRLQVGNDDFFIDLLFYHRDLQCLVAFELKIDKFKPAYLGQLEFYLEALDRDVKREYENPSIGVLLCKDKNDKVVEYALNRSMSPTVIAEYETKLIPKEILSNKLNELYNLLNKD